MCAAVLSLASCSSDDDSNVYEAAELGGTWQKVYDEGVELPSPWIATSAASPARR